MTSEPLLLAIDGGQTATKSLLATSRGKVVAAGRGGPADHFHSAGGIERNRAAIIGAATEALEATGASPANVVATALGLTGVHLASGDTTVVEGIVREILPNASTVVVPDYVTNLAGASAGAPGVVVIAGGGGIAYGVTHDGSEALSSGFGYLIGDEGSASDIGRRAIATACRASDGRGPTTTLEPRLCAAFGIETMRQITRIVYHADFRRERISLLAPLVAAAARDGDSEATAILERAGADLAMSAVAVIAKLHRPGTEVGVYPTGGVFTAGALIQQSFHETLRRECPAAAVHEPSFPPVVGGLILAARQMGIEPDEAWFHRIQGTLPQ